MQKSIARNCIRLIYRLTLSYTNYYGCLNQPATYIEHPIVHGSIRPAIPDGAFFVYTSIVVYHHIYCHSNCDKHGLDEYSVNRLDRKT